MYYGFIFSDISNYCYYKLIQSIPSTTTVGSISR
jgi:hypothetical protein